MDDAQLVRILSALATKIALQECQLLALRRVLDKRRIVNDEELEEMIAKVLETYKKALDPQRGASEQLAEFLRKFEGTVQ